MALVVVLLLGLWLAQAAVAEEAAKFISPKPAFAKIALTADEKTVLTLAFDASKEDGPYDIVYADLDFDGVFEVNEKLLGTGAQEMVIFPTLKLNVPYNEFGAGVKEPLTLTLARLATPNGGQNYTALLRARLAQDDEQWSYTFRGNLQLFMDLADVLPATTQPLRTEITTAPGNGVGVAVKLAAGDFSLNCQTPQGNPQVRLRVLSNGNVTHDETVPLDRLGYG